MQSHFARHLLASACLMLTASTAMAGDVTVSAAASLNNAFADIIQVFQAQHPGTKVALNTGASGALLQQMAKGAPVDVFASADEETMDAAVKLGLVKPAERHDFAGNTLMVVVPADAAQAPTELEQLTRPQYRRIAIGNPASVPAGRYARRALESARLWNVLEARAILTQNVRQALDYVARGEVDAGMVYATDAASAQGKVRLAFPVALDMPIRYPIAPLAGANAEARQFVAFVLSPTGQAILAKSGFSKP